MMLLGVSESREFEGRRYGLRAVDIEIVKVQNTVKNSPGSADWQTQAPHRCLAVIEVSKKHYISLIFHHFFWLFR